MASEPIRPPTKANSTNRKGWRCYALAVGVLCILAVPVVAQSCMPSPSCMNPQFNLSAYYGGQDITINECIDPNSPSCAWADAVMVPNMADATKYFLACSLPANASPIALCYYSGVPGAPTEHSKLHLVAGRQCRSMQLLRNQCEHSRRNWAVQLLLCRAYRHSEPGSLQPNSRRLPSAVTAPSTA